jgi:hypothetical protein
MIDKLSGIKYKEAAKYAQQKKEITKLTLHLHISCLYQQAPQFSEMASPTEKSFCVTEYTKTNSCTSVQWAFRKPYRKDPPPRA